MISVPDVGGGVDLWPTSYNYTVITNLDFDNEVIVIQSYDASSEVFLDIDRKDDFLPGNGYLTHTTQDCDWIVLA
jgi:hypothetical protein